MPLKTGGAFPKEMAVDERLRALEAPMRAPGAPGHGLSADYWADSLPPPYFEKKKYGTANEGGTPATTTLEWCIPSPPDFHHFNMVPKMVAAPLPDAKVGKIAAH